MRLRHTLAAALAFLALPLFAEQHVNLAKGFNANSVYQVNDYDSINAFNGNLTISVPIGNSYSITDGFPLKLVLYNNSNVWESETYSGPNCSSEAFNVAFPHRRTNAGIGWILTLGRLFDPTDPNGGNGSWTYESPDGAEHPFSSTPAGVQGSAAVAGVFYTRDGTFLRMTTAADFMSRKIEFPDGTVHTFEPYQNSLSSGQWVLTKMGNRFNSELVRIDYRYDSKNRIDRWTITDVPGNKTHVVNLGEKEYNNVGSMAMFITSVDLTAFDGSSASYGLEYKRSVVGRQLDMHTAPKQCNNVFRTAVVQFLSGITMPDGSRYGFSYNESIGGIGPIALPTRMVLPTGGSIQWAWGRYDKPGWSADEAYYQYSWGITTRTLYPRNSTVASGIWTYDARGEEDLDYGSHDPNHEEELQITTITDPAGKVTESYFNMASNKPINHLEPGPHYSRPFSPLHPDEAASSTPRYLSSRTLVGTQVQQSTFVRYEDDPVSNVGLIPVGRVVSQRGQQDADPVSVSPFVKRYVDTDYSRYDGFGHYRVATTSGTALGKTTTSAGIVRTNTTEFANPNDTQSGDLIRIPAGNAWLGGLFTSVTATESGPSVSTSSSSTEYQFDSGNGFLKGKRTIRGSGKPDLFSVFTADTFGNVKTESYYGGDTTPPISTTLAALIAAPASQTVAFKLTHEYTAGVRRQTKYNGASFFSADFDIDVATRLPKVGRDSALVATAYAYDNSGRIQKVTPAEGAWTDYEYTSATTTDPASITVSQYPEDGSATAGTELTQVRYYFDGFGRLVQESRKMPVNWSTTWTAYDVLGRKVAVTTARPTTTSNYAAYPAGDEQSVIVYDALGRVTNTTQPDGKFGTVFYTGSRLTKRTQAIAVATSAISTANPLVQELPQSTLEEVDGFGRLVNVTENSTGTNGADSFLTQYQYDVGDRLTKVTMPDLIDPDNVKQIRTFTYDGAGLLLSEQHPESGTTSYEYNARGQVLKRTIATGTVMTYTYDSAERLTDVKQDGTKFKEFRFDRAGDSLALGRPDYSIRYNRDSTLAQPITVKEIYRYDTSGRLAKKETVLGSGESATPSGESFADSYTYDALGSIARLGYPVCTGCTGLLAPSREVSTVRKSGLTTRVTGYTSDTSDIQYWPSGLVKSIPHRNVVPPASPALAGPLYEQTASFGMARPESIKVTNVCTDLTVTSPQSSNSGQIGTNVTLTVTASSGATVQWYLRTATADSLISGATGSTYSPVVSSLPKTYFARAGNGSCTVDSDPATVTATTTGCDPDTLITVNPPVMSAYATGSASVVATSGATYAWSILTGNGTFNGSTTGTSVSFTATCPGVLTLKVVVTTSCTSEEGTADVDVTPLLSHVSGTATLTGASVPISATLPGPGGWEVLWSDNVTTSHMTGPAVRNVSPTTTTSYSVVHVTDGNGCQAVGDGSAAIITVGTTTCTTPVTDMEPVGEIIASTLFPIHLFDQVAGESYEWVVTNGFDMGVTQGLHYFRPKCSGQMTIELTITASCGAQRTRTQTITILPPLAEITSANSGPYTFNPGGSPVTLRANVRGVVPTITWSDGFSQKVSVGATGVGQRTVTPTVSTIYTVTSIVDSQGCSGSTLGQAIVNVCTPAPATITVASTTMSSYATQQASVPQTSGATYTWSINNGTITSGQGTSNVTFKASCSGTVTLSISVSNNCGAPSTDSKLITVTPAAAIVSGSTSIGQGSSTSIQVTLPGTGPWSVRWSDQATATAVSTSPYVRTGIAPSGTTTYTVISATDSTGCAAAPTGSAVVTVIPPAPGALVATAISVTQVRVAWSFTGTADSVDLYRDGTRIAEHAVSPYTDTVGSATAHTYYAIAVKNGTSSPRSAVDLATTVLFTDPSILPGIHDRKIVHIAELRTAVNAVRAAAGLPAATFTDASLTGLMPRALHIQELQDRLDEGRVALGLAATGYTRRPVTGQYMQTIDVIGIRGGVQ
jgi:YD repeat-containing protein